MKAPKLAKGYKHNYDTLLQAAENGDLALMSAIRKSDQQPVALVCAMNRHENEDISMVPLAVMVEGNPYELYEPPGD